jgi:1-acyl-sn-glycerol-3-phosphate acyltransferase
MPLLARVRITGRERVPRKGGFILVSNHISHFDPHLLGMVSPRRIDWMASDVLFRHPLSAFYFRNVGTIFVRQYQADHGALLEAVRRARRGQCIGVFAEGGIRAGETSLVGGRPQLYDGAFMIAVLGRAPIVPCLVLGTDRLYQPGNLLKRPPLWFRFGHPISVEGATREDAPALREKFLVAFRALVEEVRNEGKIRDNDWPQTPQQRNPKIPMPSKEAASGEQ